MGSSNTVIILKNLYLNQASIERKLIEMNVQERFKMIGSFTPKRFIVAQSLAQGRSANQISHVTCIGIAARVR